MNDNSYLLVFDFDGTCFDTFEPSPKGIGVHEAYEMAIEMIFGGFGLGLYRGLGGLNNGAPEEIIDAMFKEVGPEGRKNLLEDAEKCYDEKNKTLRRLVPQGKGAALEWRSGDEKQLRRTIAEMLVLIKMSLMIDEIGSELPDGEIWPRPCKGFLSFYETIEKLRIQGIDIQFAIISSGHDEFIKKTFSTWGLEPPTIMITDDDMRGRVHPEAVEDRVKPSPFLFDLVQAQWIGKDVLFTEYARHIELIMGSRKRMMYFGDDIKKDGGLAKNAGVVFGHFDSKETGFRCNDVEGNKVTFSDWNFMAEFFSTDLCIERIKYGAEFKKTFF